MATRDRSDGSNGVLVPSKRLGTVSDNNNRMSDNNKMPDNSKSDINKTDNNNVTTVGPRASMVGSLRIEGDLNVHGNIEGEISVTGDVRVESTATVQASIEGSNVTIRGQVTGDVIATKRLQLSGSGTLNGDARVGRLVVEDGATVNGAITMGVSAPGTASSSHHGTWVDSTETVYEPAMDEPAAEVPSIADDYS